MKCGYKAPKLIILDFHKNTLALKVKVSGVVDSFLKYADQNTLKNKNPGLNILF